MSLTTKTFFSLFVALLVLDISESNVHHKRPRLNYNHNLCRGEECKKESQEKKAVGCLKGEPCMNLDKTINEKELECHQAEGCDRSIIREKEENMETACQPHEKECKKKRTFNKARREKIIASDTACPSGFECTRSLSDIEAAKLGFENSLTLRGCPPGLWCKRAVKNTRIKSGRQSSRSLSGCPPGLWCKRSLSTIQAKKLGFKNSLSLRGCPPGLWCKRKASSSLTGCPLGLWCKRGLDKSSEMAIVFENTDSTPKCLPGRQGCKRNLKSRQPDAMEIALDQTKKPSCPPGLWCKRDSSLSCPPGLWCKRNLSLSDKRHSSTSSDTMSNCPPGLWCKRDVDLDGFEEENNCPPGLWCKRDTRLSLCPKGHQCKRSSKKYDVLAERLER